MSAGLVRQPSPPTKACGGSRPFICRVGKELFTLLDAIMACGTDIIGRAIWDKYGKWPVYSKFFDNMGTIPITCSKVPNKQPL